MSVIQTLREKYAKLTGGLVVLALLGFVLMDLGRGGGTRSTTIGKVDGEKIDMSDFEARLNRQKSLYEQQMGGQTLTSDQEGQLRDQVWQTLVREKVMSEINEKLGVRITDAEMNNYLTGPNPDPMIRQQFVNPQTGQYDPQFAAAQIQQIKRDPNQKAAWSEFEANVKERQLDQKMSSLLVGAIYVPKFLAETQLGDAEVVANADMVKIPFSLVNDDQAKVTDQDINNYIKEHPRRFKVKKASRSIKYISIPVVPSSMDSARVLTALDTLKNGLATTDDVPTFVNHNSENATPPIYYSKERLSTLPNADELMNGVIGQIVGPFYDGANYNIVKIMDRKAMPDTVVARHILVAIKQGNNQIHSEAEAKARIDSAINGLNAGVPFTTLAQQYSDDQNSSADGEAGHEYTLAQKQGIADIYGEEFGDFIFNANPGEGKLIKIEEDNYTAYNYVQLLSKSAPQPAVKLAFVTRSMNPSDDSYKAIFNKATTFSSEVVSSEGKKSFDEIASEHGYVPMSANGLDANSYMVQGLGSAQNVVKWAFDKNTKVGDASAVFSVNSNFIIAQLTSVQPEGLLKLTEENREPLKQLVMNRKKAQIIMDKYKTKPASLEAVAQKEKVEVLALDSIRFVQSSSLNLGNEPKVVGALFNSELKEQALSSAIPGNEGVYFVQLKSRGKHDLPNRPTVEQVQANMLMSLRQAAFQGLLNSITDKAKVKDMRSNIY